MSHDRGCGCGLERWEYPECPRGRDCIKWVDEPEDRVRPSDRTALEKLVSMAEKARYGHEDPNKRQVGGGHYKTDMEHWDLVENAGLGYLEGCATKYVTRWRKKAGLQDLEKALHYVDKLISLASRPLAPRKNRGQAAVEDLLRYAVANELGARETLVMCLLCRWTGPEDLERARDEIAEMIRLEREKGETKTSGQDHPFGYFADEEIR